MLTILEQGSPGFAEAMVALVDRGAQALDTVEPAARQILGDVRHGGDAMVRRYAQRMDGHNPTTLIDREPDGEGALGRLPRDVVTALRAAAGRAQRFLQRQREADFRYDEGGLTLGQRLRPVRRAAICAPPGRYRSALSVLLAAMPARVAGVTDLLLAAPDFDDLTLAAAHLAGVTALVRVGGAHAVAALAFGTETIPRVDVIAGDGGLHASCAKRLAFGYVHIDGLGGPPELLALVDGSAQPALVAADLLATAEQDESAWPLVIATERRVLTALEHELARQLGGLPRRAVAASSLEQNGRALLVRQRDQMLELAEQLAPAQAVFHLDRPEDAFERLRSVGLATWGALTPVHTALLGGSPPSGGAARFWGPTGVGSFLTRTAYARSSAVALRAQADGQAALARADGRVGQVRSVEQRLGLPEAKER